MKPEIRVTLRKPEVKKALGYSDSQLGTIFSRGGYWLPFLNYRRGSRCRRAAETIAKSQVAAAGQETVTLQTHLCACGDGLRACCVR